MSITPGNLLNEQITKAVFSDFYMTKN